MEKPITPFESGGSNFTFLASLFRLHGVRCILVGGYAVVAHNIQRTTFDIDFLTTLDEYQRIEPDLLAAGYTVFNRNPAFVQLRSQKLGRRDLDFLLTDSHTVESFLHDGKTVSIAGEDFFIPSPLHLIAMKLHSLSGNPDREYKDLPDLMQLLERHDIDPQSDEIHTMFAKYNSLRLYDKAVEAFKNRHSRK